MAATKKKAAPNTEKQNQKHDESYKSVLSNAANFLHFLKKYLPPPVSLNVFNGFIKTLATKSLQTAAIVPHTFTF
ncbi:hypothetical protein R80B4_00188 [Fibrobacteres bacterium R8-0-B4]